MTLPEILNLYPNILNITTSLLLILPFVFLLFNRRLLYGLYVISIVANLPLLFMLKFHYSYEILLSTLVLISIFKEWYFNRSISYKVNKKATLVVISLVFIFLVNIITSLFNINILEIKRISLIFVSNIFILLLFIYFIKDSHHRNLVIKSFIIGGVILAISIFFELYHNYYLLHITHHRYGGLLIDQNGAALVLNMSFILSFYIDRFYHSFILVVRLIFRIILVVGLFVTASRSGLIILSVIVLLLLAHYVTNKILSYKAVSFVFILCILVFIFRHTISNFLMEFTKMVDLERIFNFFKYPITPPSDGSNLSPGGIPPVVMDEQTSGRWQLMLNSIRVIKGNWLVGVGIGNLPSFIDPNYHMNSHNLWLQLIGESGIVMAFTLMVFGIVLLFSVFSKEFKNKFIFICGLIGLLIDSFFNHNLFNLNLVWLFMSIVLASIILSSNNIYEFVFSKKMTLKKKEYINYQSIYEKKYDYDFTILTPTYNRAHLLRNLYDSLIYQKYKNFEWIIINDGSSDDTIDIINSFIKEDKICIRTINQVNSGKHIAINTGLNIAKGRYCLIVDSDDYLTIEALETLSAWFLDNECKKYRICGVAGLKANPTLEVIGTFPKLKTSIIANNIERDRLSLQKDKAECFYTDILRRYPFMQLENEKYLSERVIWDKMADDGYSIVWHDKIIYICEYQEEGLTSQGGMLLIENPLGYTEFIKGFLKYDYQIKSRIYHIGSYVYHIKKRYNYTYKEISKVTNIRIIEIIWCYGNHQILKYIKSRL